MGRREEAIDQARARGNSIRSRLLMNQTAGNVLMLARDYDGAIDRITECTLELDPHFAAAHSVLGYVYGLKGMHQEALTQFEKRSGLSPASIRRIDASMQALEGWVYAAWGKRSEAKKALEEVSRSTGCAAIIRSQRSTPH